MRLEVEACDACPVVDGATIHRSGQRGWALSDLQAFDVADWSDDEPRERLLCPDHARVLRLAAGIVPAELP